VYTLPTSLFLCTVIDSGLVGSTVGRGTTRAEDAQGTPTQSHISPSILVCEDKFTSIRRYAVPGVISPSILVYEDKYPCPAPGERGAGVLCVWDDRFFAVYAPHISFYVQ